MATQKRHHAKPETLLDRTRKLMRRLGLRARKGLGQHFLIDEEIVDKILSAAALKPGDVVIDVGPGLGVLTEKLALEVSGVVAVELDDKLADILKEKLSEAGNVTIINEDILQISPEALLIEAGRDAANYKVVANLPYYITSPVLRHFLEAKAKPESMVVMVQKEVAEEITAKPGKMSLLSIGVQVYGEPTIVEHVPADSFYPAPEVDSAVIKVIPYAKPALDTADEEGFFTVVRAGFSAARKQIINSLARGLGLSREETLELLNQAAIEPTRRAETLSIEEWVRLWRLHTGKKER